MPLEMAEVDVIAGVLVTASWASWSGGAAVYCLASCTVGGRAVACCLVWG